MARIGLIFGSFNPVHNGHIAMAKKALSKKLVDIVWFVPAKQNPFKPKYEVSNWNRVSMLELAVETDKNLGVCFADLLIESTKTYDVITYIKENDAQNHNIIIICGNDTYDEIPQWYRGEELLSNEKFIIVKRNSKGNYEENQNVVGILSLDIKFACISSTLIRDLIKQETLTFVPKMVKQYILNYNLYRDA